MKTILLTGATGFVGSNLLKIDNSFHCVVRKSEPHTEQSIFTITALDGNTDWGGAFNGIKSIIHLAGLAHSHSYTEENYRTVNVDGTLRLASEAAIAGVKRFVFVSSIGVNGTATYETPFTEVSKASPHNAYAQSKYDAEIGLQKIAEKTGLEVVIVRPTLVYGINAPGNFGLLTRLVNRVPFLPFGSAKNKRDFISVNNLADLLITCAKHPDASGHTFLASENETVSIKEFTNAIAEGLDSGLIQLPFPMIFIRLVGKLTGKLAMVEQLVGNLEVDSSNLKEVLGWTPPYTMEESMAFLKEQK
ncbi:NAD-dependent epimerase/dehydratase family protein [Aliivibrio sp. 1S128]|uniref:NAD-dependent epimerase/dehydratase family protein n=1 Tax=Aliivibrio sp. 1S128 TaxID=1840085 RepID=UPI00080EDD3A|nr:NAD-dependent epimerase/dehydratase family protein [Aliivibrio sp. 1S128]OCH25524.1 UDP-glucose 4-epimerase [Aliivibrio sp. 1S128]